MMYNSTPFPGHRGGFRGREYGPPMRHHIRAKNHFDPAFATSRNQNNEEYWCETCDRGFPTVDILDKHKQQHQKCNIDGCQFVAHPKVITKHIQMQHSSGLYKKISKLDNPEDIRKWREERKNKYPTRINIEKKAAQYKENVERGEKMSLKQGRYDNHRSKLHSSHPEHTRDRKRKHRFNKNKQNLKANSIPYLKRCINDVNNKDSPMAKKSPKSMPNISPTFNKNNLKPFPGILNIVLDDNVVEESNNVLDNDNLIEDDYYEEPMVCTVKKAAEEPVVCGALSSLVCDYGSSDDEVAEQKNLMKSDAKDNKVAETRQSKDLRNLEAVNSESIKKDVPGDKFKENTTENINISNKEDSDDDSGPEEIKSLKADEDSHLQVATSKPKEAPLPTKHSIQPRNDHRQKYRHKLPSTLLQKLLHREIRQERNIVLQCIRYIKMNNYFDKAVK